MTAQMQTECHAPYGRHPRTRPRCAVNASPVLAGSAPTQTTAQCPPESQKGGGRPRVIRSMAVLKASDPLVESSALNSNMTAHLGRERHASPGRQRRRSTSVVKANRPLVASAPNTLQRPNVLVKAKRALAAVEGAIQRGFERPKLNGRALTNTTQPIQLTVERQTADGRLIEGAIQMGVECHANIGRALNSLRNQRPSLPLNATGKLAAERAMVIQIGCERRNRVGHHRPIGSGV